MKKILELIILILLWIALTWSFQLPDLIAGLVVALLAVWLFSDLFPAEIGRRRAGRPLRGPANCPEFFGVDSASGERFAPWDGRVESQADIRPV